MKERLQKVDIKINYVRTNNLQSFKLWMGREKSNKVEYTNVSIVKLAKRTRADNTVLGYSSTNDAKAVAIINEHKKTALKCTKYK